MSNPLVDSGVEHSQVALSRSAVRLSACGQLRAVSKEFNLGRHCEVHNVNIYPRRLELFAKTVCGLRSERTSTGSAELVLLQPRRLESGRRFTRRIMFAIKLRSLSNTNYRCIIIGAPRYLLCVLNTIQSRIERKPFKKLNPR